MDLREGLFILMRSHHICPSRNSKKGGEKVLGTQAPSLSSITSNKPDSGLVSVFLLQQSGCPAYNKSFVETANVTGIGSR